MLGYAEDEAIGMHFGEILAPPVGEGGASAQWADILIPRLAKVNKRPGMLPAGEECRGQPEVSLGVAIVKGNCLLQESGRLFPLLLDCQPARLVDKFLPVLLILFNEPITVLALEG